jgi:predicted DsbA family dithiol-disulfide isomerase
LADTPEKFREYAKKIGVDMAEFQRDMDSKQVLDRIEADRKRADAMDVQVTPTLFVNGQRLLFNSMNPQGLRKAIDDALAPKTSPSPSAHP